MCCCVDQTRFGDPEGDLASESESAVCRSVASSIHSQDCPESLYYYSDKQSFDAFAELVQVGQSGAPGLTVLHLY
jgi:hypothetical protein